MHTTAYIRRHEDELLESVSSRLLLCGKAFQADQTGALYWPAERTLIFADLRLEKGSYLAAEGAAMPPYDMLSAFEKLEEAIDRYDPPRVIALGSSFCGGDARLSLYDMDWLQDLMEAREWYWVTGPHLAPVPEEAGGLVCPHVTLGGIKFRSDPVRAPITHEIAGGMRPVARLTEYGHPVRGRCFVSNGARLILPSIGAYCAGRNVLDDAFDPLLGRNGLYVWFLNNGRVYLAPSGQLMGDGKS